MELRYSAEARAELDNAITWYEEHGAGLGRRFKIVCDQAESMLLSQPLAWPRNGMRTRRYLVGTFPYELIYLIKGDQITIIAVAHSSRRPGYWRTRLQH